MEPEDSPTQLQNEVRFKEFYLSGEPETTKNYPLENYYHPALEPTLSKDGEMEMHLEGSLTAAMPAGEMLMVENTVVSCACLRDSYSPHTEDPYPHAAKTALSSSLNRIPLKAHRHMAHKFAKLITDLEASTILEEKVKLDNCISRLDARRHPRAVIPFLKVEVGVNPESLRIQKRGPWNEVEAVGVQRTLDYERVWNIIANNAMSFKVRSTTREQPSQVETCELWGMWLFTSYINHSCAPNCHAMRVGDAIIIRAAMPIPAGQELTLSYFDIFQPLSKRESAAQRWGFSCDCRRCAFECLLGEPYEAIQNRIMNLEQQIEKLWTMKLDKEGHRKVAENLLKKLEDQITPVRYLVERSIEPKEAELLFAKPGELSLWSDRIFASFSEALIAWYALTLREVGFPHLEGILTKTQNTARRLRFLISCVNTILTHLVSVHPGNLLCQEFYSILLKARNELIDEDLDEAMAKNLRTTKWHVRTANSFSLSYYGPNINVFNL